MHYCLVGFAQQSFFPASVISSFRVIYKAQFCDLYDIVLPALLRARMVNHFPYQPPEFFYSPQPAFLEKAHKSCFRNRSFQEIKKRALSIFTGNGWRSDERRVFFFFRQTDKNEEKCIAEFIGTTTFADTSQFSTFQRRIIKMWSFKSRKNAVKISHARSYEKALISAIVQM